MGGGSEMTKTAGCISFADHKGGVGKTDPFKNIRDVL